MLNPSIGKLINIYENRYELVTEVAKKARKIADEAEKEKIVLTEKPITTAINQLSEEKTNNQ